MSEWSDMSTAATVSVKYHYNNPIKSVGLVQSGNHCHLMISSNVTCSYHDTAEKLVNWHNTTITRSVTHLNP